MSTTLNALFSDIADAIRELDGTTEEIAANTFPERIRDVNIPIPTAMSALTYTGSEITQDFLNYNSAKMNATGITGTNAGNYTATFTLKQPYYRWADGTTEAKKVSWSIAKAEGSLTLNKTNLSLTDHGESSSIVVTRPGDGAITATSSNTSVATVSVSGNIVTVTPGMGGGSSITVKVAEGTNYEAPPDSIVTVRVWNI